MIPSGHPFGEASHHTTVQIRKKLQRWYGVIDPDAWYAAERRHLLDSCAPDPLGILKYETIDAYWEARQLMCKWMDQEQAA